MPDNPARWAALKAMGFAPRANRRRGSHPSLPRQRLPAFIADLRTRSATAVRALEFLILTNVRADAVPKATWAKMDLEQVIWSVPLVKLKDRKRRKEAFRVPLPARAAGIVLEM